MRQILDVMAIIGFPTLFACVVWIAKKMLQFGRRMEILMNAQQKQMRRELTMDYHKYIEQGHIDDDDLDMWEQSYQAYHALGENGIMDSRRSDLIRLNSEGGNHGN